MSEINYFKVFFIMYNDVTDDADVAFVNWLRMCYTCMCR
jgi:hypothetical protein